MYTPLNLTILDLETRIKNNQHEIIKVGLLIENPRGQFFKIYSLKEKASLMIESTLNDLIELSFPKRKILIYCHNLSKFDGPLLLKFLENLDNLYLKNMIKSNNGVILIEIQYKDKIILIKDSLKLIPKSLKRLSLLFSTTRKKQLPFNPRVQCTPPRSLNKYLRADLDIVKLLLKRFDYLIGNNFKINIYNQLSLPSLGATLLQLFNYNKKFITPKTKIKRFIRKSYKGGVLFSKKGKSLSMIHYDINSLYAFSMLNKHPVGRPSVTRLKNIDKIFGFVKVKNLKSFQNLLYINKFKSYYFSEELKFMKNLGVTFDIVKSYRFDHSFKVFNKFSNTMYANKEKNNNLGEILGKAILNSTYGKLGVNEHTDEPLEEQTQLNNIYTMYTPIKTKEKKPLVQYSVSSVAMASAIASYSRLTIWQYVFSKDVKPHYVNTDSLITSQTIENLPVNSKLGSFKKLIPHNYDQGIFLDLKSFILTKKLVKQVQIKGSKFSALEKLELVHKNTLQNFYEPRWNWKQTNLFTQTQKFRFGLSYNSKELIKRRSNS